MDKLTEWRLTDRGLPGKWRQRMGVFPLIEGVIPMVPKEVYAAERETGRRVVGVARRPPAAAAWQSIVRH